MGINSTLGSVKPTKPRSATTQVTASPSTYYTVVDVTSGRGSLSRVSALMHANGSTPSNNLLSVRITVDGNQIEYNGGGFRVTGNNHNSYVAYLGWAGESFDLFFNTEFYQSMKVEIRQTSASNYTLEGFVNYQIE